MISRQRSIIAYNSYFLFRRIVTAVVLLLLLNHPYLQPMCFIMLSFINQFIIVTQKPYDESYSHYLELINEVCVMYCSFTYLYMTDFANESDVKLYAGWALVGITLFTFIVNSLVALFTILMGACKVAIRVIKRTWKRKTVRMRTEFDSSKHSSQVNLFGASQTLNGNT